MLGETLKSKNLQIKYMHENQENESQIIHYKHQKQLRLYKDPTSYPLGNSEINKQPRYKNKEIKNQKDETR